MQNRKYVFAHDCVNTMHKDVIQLILCCFHCRVGQHISFLAIMQRVRILQCGQMPLQNVRLSEEIQYISVIGESTYGGATTHTGLGGLGIVRVFLYYVEGEDTAMWPNAITKCEAFGGNLVHICIYVNVWLSSTSVQKTGSVGRDLFFYNQNGD